MWLPIPYSEILKFIRRQMSVSCLCVLSTDRITLVHLFIARLGCELNLKAFELENARASNFSCKGKGHLIDFLLWRLLPINTRLSAFLS